MCKNISVFLGQSRGFSIVGTHTQRPAADTLERNTGFRKAGREHHTLTAFFHGTVFCSDQFRYFTNIFLAVEHENDMEKLKERYAQCRQH